MSQFIAIHLITIASINTDTHWRGIGLDRILNVLNFLEM